MSRFRPDRRGRPTLVLDAIEREVLADLVLQVRHLVGGPAEADPLAGLSLAEAGAESGAESGAEVPADPALARLLPDAYRDDPEGAEDFRRFTEADLRAGKVRDALLVLGDLEAADDADSVVLASAEQAEAWLRALNDVRLALGARLDVAEDSWEEAESLPEGSERRQALEVYHWLGWLQETLLECL
ncbi:MAG: hypothetical protein QOK42_1124 [Frankiaceae bacterium]|jgi:hypothetical protein|nr:hypothetical protein [Frankiaceae bacterium]